MLPAVVVVRLIFRAGAAGNLAPNRDVQPVLPAENSQFF